MTRSSSSGRSIAAAHTRMSLARPAASATTSPCTHATAQNLDSPLLNNFIWMVMGLTNAVQPVPTHERLSILILFCTMTFLTICKICATAPTFDRVMLRATLCYTIVPFVTGYCGTHLVEVPSGEIPPRPGEGSLDAPARLVETAQRSRREPRLRTARRTARRSRRISWQEFVVGPKAAEVRLDYEAQIIDLKQARFSSHQPITAT